MSFRHSFRTVVVLACVIAFAAGTAHAAELYAYTEDTRYWWYTDDPVFEILVPSNPKGSEFPLYFHRTQFGEEVLEVLMGEEGPVMTFGVLKAGESQIKEILSNLLASRKHLLKNVRVTDDRTITTSMGVRAYFYSQVAQGADGKNAMFRAVFYNQGDKLAYLTYWLYESDYTGTNRDAWIRAVNSFRWL